LPGAAASTATQHNPQMGNYLINEIIMYSDYVNFTGTVDAPPTIITNSLPNGKEGVAYNQTLIASGAQPITWSMESGELPTGLSLSESGKITGVPTDKEMLFTFTVKATNAFGEDTQELSIYIDSLVNNIISFENSPIKVYPNPAFDILYVVNENQQNMQISMFDFLGREVLNQNVFGQVQLDMSKLPAGIYNMRIQYGNVIENRKIVKK
jgi:hypothetical protein